MDNIDLLIQELRSGKWQQCKEGEYVDYSGHGGGDKLTPWHEQPKHCANGVGELLC